MDKPKRIRTSPTVLWRIIRRQLLPFVVTAAGIVAIGLLWPRVEGGGIPGMAEGVRSVVTSPRLGVLREVKVRPFQSVEAGEPLAILAPLDPRSRLDLLQSELQIARLQLEPSLADQRALDYERLRVESMRLKQEIATAEVDLQMATNVLRRNELLRAEKLVSEDTYDASVRERDRNLAEIAEKRKSLAEIEDRLNKLRDIGEPQQPGSNPRVRALVAELEGRLLEAETGWDPVTLVSPISGMVHYVNRQPGEAIVAGEALITINATKADRIVGYLRQPYTVEPELGMDVEVVTRTLRRRKFPSEVIQIGAQVETITNALAVVRLGVLMDVGLPIVVKVSPDVNVRPGEIVDILFRPAPPTPSPGGLSPARSAKAF